MLTLLCLGDANSRLGDYESALKAYFEYMFLLKTKYGTKNVRYASILENIGRAHRKKGNAKRAAEVYSEATRIRSHCHGEQSAEVAATIHCLGLSYRDCGDADKALETLEKSLRVWEKVVSSGDSCPDFDIQYASTLHDLGLLCRKRGELDDALRAYNGALKIRQAVLGGQHEDTAQTMYNIGIVYCDKGAHEEALTFYSRSLHLQRRSHVGGPRINNEMKSFTKALLASEALHMDSPTVESIQERCIVLFGRSIIDQVCCCARIFSCLSLMVDQMIVKESPQSLRHLDLDEACSEDGGALMDWIKPLMPFMTAAVNAELALTQTESADQPTDGTETPHPKLVRFCSYDFSSVPSPVDMILGSHHHLESCIKSLEKVVYEGQALSAADFEEDRPIGGGDSIYKKKNEMAKILLVLHAMTTTKEGVALREACAQAMPQINGQTWPPSRFFGVAELYRCEFEIIAASVESQPKPDEDYNFISGSPIRERLSTLISSAIRFHLRRLFDPLPMAYTLPSDKYTAPDLSGCRARTHEVVELCPPNGFDKKDESNPADGPASLWERPISHVLLLALQRVHSYFQMQDDINSCIRESGDGDLSKPTVVFALSQASHRCLEGSTKDRAFSETDLDDILHDIYLAHTCLSAARASKFILSLLRWPGVNLAIQNAGGWQDVESVSSILKMHHLDKVFSGEAHFALLSSIDELVKLLESNKKNIINAAKASQQVLQEMWSRFKRGKKKKRHPHDKIVRQVLLDDSTTAVFPSFCFPDSN
eukprot:CAMPEP_0183326826 /NCGR_PEP_ID=MMETSP0160_2-20130417/83241_1 /TAXON_ID=2839 ORGANISM="Odontella Sinensis, Strain Grunow 1884" /NCGR_SAMPLE_ID=MMETSP0160_2 /ASSEMBLY_ACC=CAM_ASM_000250 /LENGTH=767 /DNA_ID=CAMNT_0025494909 /DNA_START=52 /DNA_END=2355 /DNA_ORIENTATION=-